MLCSLNGRCVLGWPLFLRADSDVFHLEMPLSRRSLRKIVIVDPFGGEFQAIQSRVVLVDNVWGYQMIGAL